MNIIFMFFCFFHGRKCFSLKYPSSFMEDKHSFYIFYLLPWKTSVLFTFYYLYPWATGVLFLFSANLMFQRRSFSCFFSMGLILNAHRAERSTNFLIMERRKYGAMLPAKTVWRLFMPYMRELRKTMAANLPSDCTQVGTG